MKYTKEQIERADATDLFPYLTAKGYQVIREGSQYRLAEHDSICIRGNKWYRFSENRGGKAISFLTEIDGLSFPEAVRTLLGEEGQEQDSIPNLPKLEHPNPALLLLPEPAPSNTEMIRYLLSRGISETVIEDCIGHGILYQTNMFWKKSADGELQKIPSSPQAVFVGKDVQGTPRYACTRSCEDASRHEALGSDKAFAFSIPDEESKSLWVFESAIDLLSHLTLCSYSKKWYPAHRISLGGVSPSALIQFLTDHPKVRYVNLGLDADEAGREATNRIKELLESSYTIYDHPPKAGKDYNDFLLAQQESYQKRTQQRSKEEMR